MVFKKGNIPWAKGRKFTEEHKKKIGLSHTYLSGQNSPNFGKHFSEERRLNISKALKGKPKSEEHKRHLKENSGTRGKPAWNKGKPWSEEHRIKLSRSHKGKKQSEETKMKKSRIAKERGIGKWMKGRTLTEETRRKIRVSTFEYVKKMRDILYPCIGRNERKILDKLGQKLNYKILRQHPVMGYFIDGYIPQINLAIEIDEPGHYDENGKLKPNDVTRQKELKEYLGCEFLRIKDNGELICQ